MSAPGGDGARRPSLRLLPGGKAAPDTAAEGAIPEPPSWRQLLAGAALALGDQQEARLLLEAAGHLSPAELLVHFEDPAPPAAADHVASLVARRRSGAPLQWVVGTWGFRDLDVLVDGRALVPRPETEVVVGEALAALRSAGPPYEVVDLGTGSGVIALSVASECSQALVLATDASSEALELAGENLARQDENVRRRVRLARGDWFRAVPNGLTGRCALIVSNPPYLAASEWQDLDPVVRDHDPYEALVAGETGLEALSLLVAEAPAWLHPGGALVAELAPHQRSTLLELVSSSGSYSGAEVVDDLAGRPRVLVARVPA